MKSPEGTKDNIGHLPYGKIALKESLIAILSQDKQVPDFSEGYSTWKTEFDNNRAGIWSIPLSEAIGAMEEALNQ
ncbi:hypothetical protein [Paenibacillus sp. DYY-L-2]|uniref:hypothetical protein n=1 Tax=Paenibacillus sp. DYY-L-2 TaxID=3447013 RepID=UPI003F4FB5B0